MIRPVRDLTGPLEGISSFYSTGYLVTYISSFVLTWLGTALLLQNFSTRVGKIRYWIIVVIPLVYFLSQFQTSFLDIFREFRSYNPILFGISYTLFFRAIIPIGGLLFGAAFWSVARKVSKGTVRDYLVISGCGMMLLFASNQATSLILVAFPPFGVATVSFFGLACYIILIGIYSSALSVANDAVSTKIH